MFSQKPKQPVTGLIKEQGYDLLMYNWILSIENQLSISIREMQDEVLRAMSTLAGSGNTKHYFLATQTAPNKIKIVDGFDTTNANCGNVAVNKLAMAAVTATELTITADAYIYLECEGVYSSGVLTSSTNTIKQYPEEKPWETGKERILISRVLFTAPVAPATTGTITDFSNEPVSSRVLIWGAC